MIFASAPRGRCSKRLARCPRRLRLSSVSARWGWTSATCSTSWAPRILLASGPGWFWKRKLLIFGGFWCLVEIPIGVCMPPLLLLLAGGGLSLGYRLQFVVSFWPLFSFPSTADCSVSRWGFLRAESGSDGSMLTCNAGSKLKRLSDYWILRRAYGSYMAVGYNML